MWFHFRHCRNVGIYWLEGPFQGRRCQMFSQKLQPPFDWSPAKVSGGLRGGKGLKSPPEGLKDAQMENIY